MAGAAITLLYVGSDACLSVDDQLGWDVPSGFRDDVLAAVKKLLLKKLDFDGPVLGVKSDVLASTEPGRLKTNGVLWTYQFVPAAQSIRAVAFGSEPGAFAQMRVLPCSLRLQRA